MNAADARRGGWTARWRKVPAAPRVPVAAAALLALVAPIEAVTRARRSHTFDQAVGVPVGLGHGAGAPPVPGPDSARYLMVLALLGLATTLPLVLLWAQPAVSAVLVSASAVLSLTAFQTLTVAGAAAQLVAGYRLGRDGSRPPAVLLALLLAAPYPVLALAGVGESGTRVLILLLASLAPAAALAGVARRARREAMESRAVRQVAADSLLEHVARGERARIARELHDVVAHHISMIAVQAETARLATPGMPAAGAERLLAIGDTARAALTEMRRLLGVLREDAEPATETPARSSAPSARTSAEPAAQPSPEPAAKSAAQFAAQPSQEFVTRSSTESPAETGAESSVVPSAVSSAVSSALSSALSSTASSTASSMAFPAGTKAEEQAKTSGREGGKAPRRPQPGLRLWEINELLDESRDASGTGTRLILRGTPLVLDPGVELAAYRIIQEALTNARRHAPGAAVDVELHYAGDSLRLLVRDNGPGSPVAPPRGGHGLAGMRERAAAVGGELRAGPAAGGGFLVEARLPGANEASA
ncbi:sensor histidine kinase [Microtetraspora niveoalba]|uniref:sensor histidine kinase n=1 Tax=Microtetraspora niveoalba TaxID=46175 RepID=UPI001FDFCAE9|nr:histidine kinase [Microtetraspora niveoalba]